MCGHEEVCTETQIWTGRFLTMKNQGSLDYFKNQIVLKGDFDPLMFNVTTNREGFTYAVPLFVFCLSNDFCLSIPPLL